MFDRIVKRNYLIFVYDGFREVPRAHQAHAHGAMPEQERDLASLFLGKRQDLGGALARYVAVERFSPPLPQSVESRKQQQRILGRLAKCFRLFDQQTCPLRGRLGFRCGKPFDMLEWIYQCNLQLDFFATKRRRGGQRRDLTKRTCELLDGLNQRRALQ